MVRAKLYDRAVRFANKNEFTLSSVFETAIEELLEDREDDGTGDETAAPTNGKRGSVARSAS